MILILIIETCTVYSKNEVVISFDIFENSKKRDGQFIGIRS